MIIIKEALFFFSVILNQKYALFSINSRPCCFRCISLSYNPPPLFFFLKKTFYSIANAAFVGKRDKPVESIACGIGISKIRSTFADLKPLASFLVLNQQTKQSFVIN